MDSLCELYMQTPTAIPAIDDYLRKRLTPAESTIPRLPGIEMFGLSVPAGTVGGDLFEYINFQQRYDIDARVRQAMSRSAEFLDGLRSGQVPRNSVDDHVQWMRSKPGYRSEMEIEYRDARSSEQLRLVEELNQLPNAAGILLVDAEGHGTISAKIASSVHDTFHAFLLSDINRCGRVTPELFENLNLRLAYSVAPRNALASAEKESAQEIATLLYGEVHLSGGFRFVNCGHPPPLLFSAESHTLTEIDETRMVHFLPLGLQLPEDHPDRNRYLSLQLRHRWAASRDLGNTSVLNRGDILFLYTDGVYDGSDVCNRRRLAEVLEGHSAQSAREICLATMECALATDDALRQRGEEDLIDDKTVFVIKRN